MPSNRAGITTDTLQSLQHLPSSTGAALCPPPQTTLPVHGSISSPISPSQITHTLSLFIFTTSGDYIKYKMPSIIAENFILAFLDKAMPLQNLLRFIDFAKKSILHKRYRQFNLYFIHFAVLVV